MQTLTSDSLKELFHFEIIKVVTKDLSFRRRNLLRQNVQHLGVVEGPFVVKEMVELHHARVDFLLDLEQPASSRQRDIRKMRNN